MATKPTDNSPDQLVDPASIPDGPAGNPAPPPPAELPDAPEPAPEPEPPEPQNGEIGPAGRNDPADEGAAEPWSLLQEAANRGINPAQFSTEQELAGALFQAVDEYQTQQPFVNIGRQFAPYADKLDDFRKWQDEQQAPEPEPEPEPEQNKWDWSAPEYDPEWERFVEMGDNGLFQPLGGLAGAQVYADKLNQRRQWQQRTLNSFLDNPQPIVQQAVAADFASMRKELIDEAKQIVSDSFQKQTTQTEDERFWANPDFYEVDANGNMQVGADGRAVHNKLGLAAGQYHQQYAQRSHWTDAEVKEAVMRDIDLDVANGTFAAATPPAAAPTAEPPSPVTQPPAKKKRFLNRVRNNNRGGTVPDPTAPAGTPQNPGDSMAEITNRIMNERGVTD